MFFSEFKYRMFYVLYSFVIYLLTLPRIYATCLNILNSAFCPFRMILTINSDCFLCNGDVTCFL
jgi:hypothetical protein